MTSAAVFLHVAGRGGTGDQSVMGPFNSDRAGMTLMTGDTSNIMGIINGHHMTLQTPPAMKLIRTVGRVAAAEHEKGKQGCEQGGKGH